MAIEDEIINIAELDVGTELLRNDKLLIETSNGTKLLDFKDFIIGPDNISTIREDQIESSGDSTNAGNTRSSGKAFFDNLSGYEILNTETTAGLQTRYRDVSGTVELTKRLAEENTVFGEMSATIAANESDIATLKANLASITTTLRSTSALSAVSITTKSTNFKVNAESDSFRKDDTQLAFNAIELNPTDTNDGVVFTTNPFSITYPDDETYMTTWVTFLGNLVVRWDSAAQEEVYIYKTSKGGQPVKIFRKQFERRSSFGFGGMGQRMYVEINQIVQIKPGDKITLETDRKVTLLAGSHFAGVQLGN